MNESKSMTYRIISLGCKVNYYEKEALESLLESKGFLMAKDNEKADIAIINTCAVTEEASRKSKQMIRRLIKNDKPEVTICMGCLTQIDNSIKDIEGVDIVLGSTNKFELYNELMNYLNNQKQIINIKNDVFKSEYDNFTLKEYKAHTRAFMKIEDGCTNFCSYCIIPYARGNIRSKPLDMAISEAKELVKNGHKEIIISGIHTGAYGKDLGITLYDLLLELSKVEGLLRIRISSIEINQITDEIIDLIKNNSKFVHHLHIPLQAGSNHVLKLMNRHYTVDEFIERIKYIKEEIPNISITTDYITGFPEESDEDFNESLNNLKIINFSTIHTFPFSLRKGTRAEKMVQVDPKIKKERTNRVLELSSVGYKEYVISNIGRVIDVIFETFKDGYVYGHTSNFIYVRMKGSPSILNKLVYVKITGFENNIGECETSEQ